VFVCSVCVCVCVCVCVYVCRGPGDGGRLDRIALACVRTGMKAAAAVLAAPSVSSIMYGV